jgi:hypothetical protein
VGGRYHFVVVVVVAIAINDNDSYKHYTIRIINNYNIYKYYLFINNCHETTDATPGEWRFAASGNVFPRPELLLASCAGVLHFETSERQQRPVSASLECR